MRHATPKELKLLRGKYPSANPCPRCGEVLGLNPEHNGVREIYCYSEYCDFFAALKLGSCGEWPHMMDE